MGKIVVIGGGWAGVSAAIRAVKQGHKVCLVEKTDLLLGLGNVGGIMRNNGRFTACEEAISMGAGELFEITDSLSTHTNIDFPGHSHASFYDVDFAEARVRRLLEKLGVEIRFMTRAVGVVTRKEREEGSERICTNYGEERGENLIKGIKTIEIQGGKRNEEYIEGDVFVETTGSSGPMGNCSSQGNGCAMCILRCPAFGPRVSMTERLGDWDVSATRKGGFKGAFSGSCKISKRTLSPWLQKKLKKDGFVVIPLPKEMVNRDKLSNKVCQQYALDSFAENIVLIDTGQAKLMSPYMKLEELRKLDGFEEAKYIDPYGASLGNSMRYMAVGRRDRYMRSRICKNLFLGGEKSGFFVGHTEAITTGALAGYNAGKLAHYIDEKRKEPPSDAQKGEISSSGPKEETVFLTLPKETCIGRILLEGEKLLETEEGLSHRLTYAGGEFFEIMKKEGLYTTDKGLIAERIKSLGLANVYSN